jgi:predicted RNA-binding protein with PIN domain
MSTQLELTLSHDGYSWITNGLYKQLSGKDLHCLEDNIINAINIDSRFTSNESIDVILRFDMDNFPRWLHQYQSHYFNYTFTVNKQKMD